MNQFSLALLSFSLASVAQAQPVFKDNFETAEVGENVATVSSAASWTSAGNRAFIGVVEDADGLKSGKALVLSKGLVYTTFDPVSLGVGDSLKLTFRMRCTQELPERAFPLRFGFYDDVQGQPENGMAKGYWVVTALGEAGNGMVASELGEDGSLGGGKDIPIVGKAFAPLKAGAVANKVAVTITRGADDSMDITVQFNDEAPETRTDSEMKLAEFNAFAIRFSSENPGKLLFDDFEAEVERKK